MSDKLVGQDEKFIDGYKKGLEEIKYFLEDEVNQTLLAIKEFSDSLIEMIDEKLTHIN